MSQLFLKLLNMSISASWVILAVLVLRLVLKKAPKWIYVLMWGFVAIRLICPFSIESEYSLIPSTSRVNIVDTLPSFVPETDSNYIAGSDYVADDVDFITEVNTPVQKDSTSPKRTVTVVLSIFWLLGTLDMGLYTAVSYVGLKRRLMAAVPVRKNVYYSERITSPFVFGIIKPKIYLPFTVSEQNTDYIVAHELAHIKRKDHLWKLCGFALLAVYWFNPLMWLSYILLCRDIELACDEKVIEGMESRERADYTQALVNCSKGGVRITACPLAFGEIGVKERVKNVLNYKEPRFWIIILAIIACIAVAVCFLTNPKNDVDKDKTADAVGISVDDIKVSSYIEVPNAALSLGKKVILENIQKHNEIGKKHGYTITEAQMTSLEPISTGTAGNASGQNLYRLEYRLSVDNPEKLASSDKGVFTEKGKITERSHSGQPYLLLHWEETGGQVIWQPVCVTSTSIIESKYATQEMLDKYGNAYTAAAVELYAENKSYTVCAFLRNIDGNTVTVDAAEYIERDDTERAAELGLDEGDFPNGYYIHNPEKNTAEYTLTENTVYNFIDWNRQFVELGEDLHYSTQNVEEFKAYIATYTDSKPGMPFFFEIKDGKVISINEKIMM